MLIHSVIVAKLIHFVSQTLLSGTAFYERFKHHYPKICKHFVASPTDIAPLADALMNKGLITTVTAGAVKFPDGTGPYDKATKMLNPVLQGLQDHPDYREKFISALRDCNLSVVIRLLEKYVYCRCSTEPCSCHDKKFDLCILQVYYMLIK